MPPDSIGCLGSKGRNLVFQTRVIGVPARTDGASPFSKPLSLVMSVMVRTRQVSLLANQDVPVFDVHVLASVQLQANVSFPASGIVLQFR